jgi:hypothetical protein
MLIDDKQKTLQKMTLLRRPVLYSVVRVLVKIKRSKY